MPVHSAMTDPEVHEPKDITTAASGTVYVADGLGSGTWTVSVNQDAPSDDIPYSRVNGEWKAAPVNPVDSYWRADTTGIAAPPGTGDIIWNNATQSLATHLFISKDTTLGVDKRPEMLNYVQDYDTLTLYEAGAPNTFQRWKITNAVDGTSYIDYTVDLIASNGGNISDNTETIVTFQANLVDAAFDTWLAGLAGASASDVFVADGAGSGAWADKDYYDPTHWDDVTTSLISASAGPLSAPGLVQMATDGAGSQGVYAYHFDNAVEEELLFSVQLPHRYKAGTDLKPHIHWAASTAAAGDVVWGLEYWVLKYDTSAPANTTVLNVTDATPTEAYKPQIASFGTITGTGIKESDIIVCRVFRKAADAADTYAADAIALDVDFHYEVEKPGTVNEFPA